jgi:hypothetical protein
LHVAVAAHRTASPGLLDWLAATDDPAVLRVIAARTAQPTVVGTPESQPDYQTALYPAVSTQPQRGMQQPAPTQYQSQTQAPVASRPLRLWRGLSRWVKLALCVVVAAAVGVVVWLVASGDEYPTRVPDLATASRWDRIDLTAGLRDLGNDYSVNVSDSGKDSIVIAVIEDYDHDQVIIRGIDLADGKVLWTADPLPGEWEGTSTDPTGRSDVVVLRHYDEDETFLTSLDISTGTVVSGNVPMSDSDIHSMWLRDGVLVLQNYFDDVSWAVEASDLNHQLWIVSAVSSIIFRFANAYYLSTTDGVRLFATGERAGFGADSNEGTTYFASGGHVFRYGYGEHNTLISFEPWDTKADRPLLGQSACSNRPDGARPFATPAIYGYIDEESEQMRACSLSDGALVWNSRLDDDFLGSTSVTDKSGAGVIVLHYGDYDFSDTSMVVDASTGELVGRMSGYFRTTGTHIAYLLVDSHRLAAYDVTAPGVPRLWTMDIPDDDATVVFSANHVYTTSNTAIYVLRP